ncbi:MAG: hypothetical protein DRJ01_01190 [Bacteroidetes bacterium]|nr:MAG: hypothetical protein DRJ01_01190 [Bacteroidota bacterium]
MLCENCEKEHDGSYGSGRFCSARCARGFSTRAKRKEINEKVSRKLSFDNKSKHEREKEKKKSYIREQEIFSILEVSKRTVSKILIRMNLRCSVCGWNESVCDIHHIIPKSEGGSDEHTNLTYLCPNCHRLAHKDKLKDFVNLWDYIGESWREFYYVKQGKIIPAQNLTTKE